MFSCHTEFFSDCIHFWIRTYRLALLGDGPTIQRSGANYASSERASENAEQAAKDHGPKRTGTSDPPEKEFLYPKIWLPDYARTASPDRAVQVKLTIMFGECWLAMLLGVALVSHQLGGFLGVWLGGFLFEQTGSYDAVWWLAILFGLLSAAINLPFVEKPVHRLALASA
jgi:hypothetical protein